MDQFDWKQTIKPNIIMLKLFGLWPKDGEIYGINLYTMYAFSVVAIFQLGHTVVQTVNLYYIKEDLQALTGTFYVVVMCMAILLKTGCFMRNINLLKNLMVTVNCKTFQPKSLKQRELILPNLRGWTNFVRVFWFSAIVYSVFCALFPILDKGYKEHRLPFLAWYPFDYKKSPQYELTYIHQVFALNIISGSNVNMNTLIAAINMYIGAQFDLLCDNLRHIRKPEDTSLEVNRKLLECIRHHKEILNFTKSSTQFYNWLLLVEFFVDGFSVGISMFQLTVVVPFSSEFYSFFSYAIAISLQIFMYCWFGNEVEIKSAKLSYAIFESDWTDLSPEVKKHLIIFTIRSLRIVQISAFGLINLSLENFVKIMRTAWSYFALLRQVSS